VDLEVLLYVSGIQAMVDEDKDGFVSEKLAWEEFWASESKSNSRRLDDEVPFGTTSEHTDELPCCPPRKVHTEPRDDDCSSRPLARQHEDYLCGLRHRAKQQFERLQGALASERLHAAVQQVTAAGPGDAGSRVLLREELRRAESEAKSLADAIAVARNTLGECAKGGLDRWPSSDRGIAETTVGTPSDCSFASSGGEPCQKLKNSQSRVESDQQSSLESQATAWLREERVKNLVEPFVQTCSQVGCDSLLYREAKAWMESEESRSQASTDDVKSNADSKTSNGSSDDQYHAESSCREAEACVRRQQALSRALANVERLVARARSADGLQELGDVKSELSLAIDAAKRHGASEADLSEAEALRRLTHNAIEDLKGSIRVFCCVRPLNRTEIERGDKQVLTSVDSMTVDVHNLWERSRFGFDAVFFPAETEAVFQDCCDLVQSAIDGQNVAMFAYGQTGAGKTHTLFGQIGQPGVTPRAIHELFRLIGRDRDRYSHRVTVSMLELYRNDLVDLFIKDSLTVGAPQKLSIRMDQGGRVQIDNLVERACSSAEELIGLIERCLRHRTTRTTAMNAQSSRSHLICTVKVSSSNQLTGCELKGKLTICDLAGSERLKKSNVAGDAAKEAIEINRSLTSLADVISALRQGPKQQPPYRNHKLTQLMQDCLGRQSKVLMFVNCAPSNSNIEETLMSLKYAARAKKIRAESSKKSSV